MINEYPVAVIGAGPVGMAAAAHLVEKKIPFILFEAGHTVGSNLLEWGHVRVFSPWRYNIDKAARRLLEQMIWKKPDENGLPTGQEIVDEYLMPLSIHPDIKPHIYLNSKVISISRKGYDKLKTKGRNDVPFEIRVQQEGRYNVFYASSIIDSSGTWNNPNPMGSGGIWAIGERDYADKIYYNIPDILGKDKESFVNKTVLVVGSGHSAVTSLLNLAQIREEYPNTTIQWALRKENISKVYGGKEADALEARGALGSNVEKMVLSGKLQIHSPFQIIQVSEDNEKLVIAGFMNGKEHQISGIDQVIVNTGARPDLSIASEVRVSLDPAVESVAALAELIDPNIHSCGTVRPHGELELRQPETNFYIVGVKSYGRAPTFLMATGYEQVRSVVAWLSGDYEAAKRVELDLPETGVCSSDGGDSGVACCGSIPDTAVTTKEETGNQCCNNQISEIMEDHKEQKNDVAETSGCCGGAPTSNEDACCKLDEEKKEAGEGGCGCNAEPEPAKVGSACC